MLWCWRDPVAFLALAIHWEETQRSSQLKGSDCALRDCCFFIQQHILPWPPGHQVVAGFQDT